MTGPVLTAVTAATGGVLAVTVADLPWEGWAAFLAAASGAFLGAAGWLKGRRADARAEQKELDGLRKAASDAGQEGARVAVEALERVIEQQRRYMGWQTEQLARAAEAEAALLAEVALLRHRVEELETAIRRFGIPMQESDVLPPRRRTDYPNTLNEGDIQRDVLDGPPPPPVAGVDLTRKPKDGHL